MKYILLVLLTIGAIILQAQSGNYSRIEGTITSYIQQGQWDEVLMRAPDLIIEDAQRGEGYYYTALAFSKIGQTEKCNNYLGRAEMLADALLKRKIALLREEIALQLEIDNSLKKASSISTQDYMGAVQAWMQLWEKDKLRIENALNAVELLLQNKKYREALEILTLPEIVKEQEAIMIIDLINQTPEMKIWNAYVAAMSNGRQYFNDKSFQLAQMQFERALELIPSDATALEMRNKSEDEAAWQIATSSHTIEAYQTYLFKQTTVKSYKQMALENIDEISWENAKNAHTQRSYQNYLDGNTLKAHKDEAFRALDELAWEKAVQSNSIDVFEGYVYSYPNGIHRKEADGIIRNSYVVFVERYCANGDEYSFLKYYNKYVARFPDDSEGINSLKGKIGAYYFSVAEPDFTNKKWQDAKENYIKCVGIMPEGPTVEIAKKRIEKCDKRIEYESRKFRFFDPVLEKEYYSPEMAFTLKENGKVFGGGLAYQLPHLRVGANYHRGYSGNILDVAQTLGGEALLCTAKYGGFYFGGGYDFNFELFENTLDEEFTKQIAPQYGYIAPDANIRRKYLKIGYLNRIETFWSFNIYFERTFYSVSSTEDLDSNPYYSWPGFSDVKSQTSTFGITITRTLEY
jgi:hypothetical protein